MKPHAWAAATVLAIAACTPTREDAIRRHAAVAQTFRSRLVAVAALLDRAPAPPEAAKCNPPEPLGFSRQGDHHDTDVFVYEDLRRGGAPSDPKDRPKVDLSQDTPLHRLLADTHPQSRLTPAEKKERNAAAEKDYERATTVRRLVVLKQRAHERDRGALTLDYFVVDLEAPKIVCVGEVVARADPNLGQRAYDVVQRDPATGQNRVVGSGETDLYWDRLTFDAEKKLEERFRDDLGIEYPKAKKEELNAR